MVCATDFGSQKGSGFESCWWQNSAHDWMALHCTESFIIIFPTADMTNFERDIKRQIIIISYYVGQEMYVRACCFRGSPMPIWHVPGVTVQNQASPSSLCTQFIAPDNAFFFFFFH